jgi:hypothetical protein
MNIKEIWQKYKKFIIVGTAAFLVGILAVVVCVCACKPKITNPPESTKEAFVTLTGKAAPRAGITVFNKQGYALVLAQTNEEGDFTLSNLPVNEGENVYYIRTVKKNWRASLATIIKIRKDTTAPSLEIGKFENLSVAGSNTTITGKAEPGSTVTVNGVQATVGEDGSWSAVVSLKPGTNEVTVTATDSAGNTTTNTETIQYTPSAPDSQTGTVDTATSTVTYSAGSLPPSTENTSEDSSSNLGPYFLDQTNPTGTIPVDEIGGTPGTVQPAPASQTILNIIANAWVSNSSPNDRSNETINATVKDNYGRPVTSASVIATVYFKNGLANYSMTHTGNGNYSVSFKLNDKFFPGYRVNVEVTARYEGFTSIADTSFTMQGLTKP